MNLIGISGRLTKTPEIKITTNGHEVCRFDVAVKRPGVKDTTDFIPCIAWRESAKFLVTYFDKGSRIEVTGKLIPEKWTDKDGNKRTSFVIESNNIGFGESRRKDGNVPQTEGKEQDAEELNSEFDDCPF